MGPRDQLFFCFFHTPEETLDSDESKEIFFMTHGVKNNTPPQESTVGVTVGEVGPLNGFMLDGFQ